MPRLLALGLLRDFGEFVFMISLVKLAKRKSCYFVHQLWYHKAFPKYDCIVDGVVTTISEHVDGYWVDFRDLNIKYVCNSKDNRTSHGIFFVCLVDGFKVHEIDSYVLKIAIVLHKNQYVFNHVLINCVTITKLSKSICY